MEKETTLRNQRLCIFLCAGIVVLLMVGSILIATISGGYMDQSHGTIAVVVISIIILFFCIGICATRKKTGKREIISAVKHIELYQIMRTGGTIEMYGNVITVGSRNSLSGTTCPNCGAVISIGNSFCMNCGVSLHDNSTQ